MGRFFAFEGISRAGKTTACGHVERRLEEIGESVRREHGGFILGARVADAFGTYPDEVVYMLFWQAFRLLELDKITPALNEGKIVLVDRYVLSNLAHNWWTGLDRDFQLRTEREYIQRCLFPSIYFVFTVPYGLFLERGGDGAKVDRALFEKIHQDYITWALRLSNNGFCKTILVDGSKSEEAVGDFVMHYIRKEIGLEGG